MGRRREYKRLEEIAKELRENADAFVLIGVGGSNNAARSVIEALKKDDAPEIIYAGNTLSPYALNQMLKRLKGKSVYIDCIAKNFETLEPGSSFRILREYMESEYGKEESAKQGKDRSAHVRGIAENHQGICKRDNGIGGQVYEI